MAGMMIVALLAAMTPGPAAAVPGPSAFQVCGALRRDREGAVLVDDAGSVVVDAPLVASAEGMAPVPLVGGGRYCLSFELTDFGPRVVSVASVPTFGDAAR